MQKRFHKLNNLFWKEMYRTRTNQVTVHDGSRLVKNNWLRHRTMIILRKTEDMQSLNMAYNNYNRFMNKLPYLEALQQTLNFTVSIRNKNKN